MPSHRPTRSRSYVPAVAVALAIGFALVASACSTSGDDASASGDNAPATTQPTTTAIAETVDIGGGRSIYIECQGSGSPTVVLQSGFGNGGDIWMQSDTGAPAVFPALAETNRVCVYDRPGSTISTTSATGDRELGPGRSGPTATPQDPTEVVTELHDVLSLAEVPGPYVLVGHSLGGVLNVLYARTYPDEVSALVTVDSSLPPYRELVGPEVWEQVRTLSFPDPGLVPGYALESYDVGVLFDEIAAGGPLPDIPVVVVRRGAPSLGEESPSFSEATIEALNNGTWEGQAAWVASVPGAELVTVDGTTHYVHLQRPDAVVDAVRAAIARS